ncbi:MAG: DUF3422 domain-containing protein [Sphingomonadaceae bacterium]|nr:DUF3422 domain-containing protein [Sphingomonadaceae bacterium]
MRFHDLRERLLGEVHARPATPLSAPVLATRIAALSGQDAVEEDRAHMAALCERFARSAPSAGMRWSWLDTGDWQLRWERHSEFSSWTFFRRRPGNGHSNAIGAVPADWIDAIPGPVLAFTTLNVGESADDFTTRLDPHDAMIASELLGGAGRLVTDLRPDGQGMTRYDLVMRQSDPILTGRLALSLLEIETYRMMALLAFPIAGDAAKQLRRIEEEAGALAARLAENLGVDDDRALLTRLVTLSGETEALNAQTSFRFGAAKAYHQILLDRIDGLGETPLGGFQTLGAFMERRLGPAMRTCISVAEREAAVIERIGRAGQMLNTRVELVTQEINANLLASMDRRTRAQLRLQHTVEGLSVVAITYYALSLLTYPLAALGKAFPSFDPKLAAGLLMLPLVAACWYLVHHLRHRIGSDPHEV